MPEAAALVAEADWCVFDCIKMYINKEGEQNLTHNLSFYLQT